LVGLVVITTIVLTVSAYRSFRDDLEGDSRRLVRAAADQIAVTVVRVIEQRQERARGFLNSVESLCGERTSSGRIAWEPAWVSQGLAECHATEPPAGALLASGPRTRAQVGEGPGARLPVRGLVARVVQRQDRFNYVIGATSGSAILTVGFSIDDL